MSVCHSSVQSAERIVSSPFCTFRGLYLKAWRYSLLDLCFYIFYYRMWLVWGSICPKDASEVLQSGTVPLNTMQTGKSPSCSSSPPRQVHPLAVHHFSDSQVKHFVLKWKKVLPGVCCGFAVKREVFIAFNMVTCDQGGNSQWRPGILVPPGNS